MKENFNINLMEKIHPIIYETYSYTVENKVSDKIKSIPFQPLNSCYHMVLLGTTTENKTLNNCNDKTDLNYYIPKSNENKLKLNILYYDECLLKNMIVSEYCAYIQMNINGTFYGCHNMSLLNLVIEKIKKSDREFILITSGSSAEKIYKKIGNIKNIREYYIYCCIKEKYLPLINKYPKLKGVYTDNRLLNDKLSIIKPTKINEEIKSSNLIFFEDYVRIYIKLHFEIIRKYALYKILKQNNFSEDKFLTKIKNVFPKFLNIAKQLFPDKNEIIDFFQKNVDEDPKFISDFFNKEDSVENYIKNYTAQSFYYKYLNKFLREGNFDYFRILSSHLSKFLYYLYEYRENHSQVNYNLTLYRKMFINQEDLNIYKKSIGRVICYPSFTSTSSDKNGFNGYNNNVLLIINSNNSKSVISIEDFSVFKNEKEYLFLPFSIFKITNVILREGTGDDPHIIYLLAMKSEKPIEEMFIYFFENYSDSLDAEGLDIIQLNYSQNEIIFNNNYYL